MSKILNDESSALDAVHDAIAGASASGKWEVFVCRMSGDDVVVNRTSYKFPNAKSLEEIKCVVGTVVDRISTAAVGLPSYPLPLAKVAEVAEVAEVVGEDDVHVCPDSQPSSVPMFNTIKDRCEQDNSKVDDADSGCEGDVEEEVAHDENDS